LGLGDRPTGSAFFGYGPGTYFVFFFAKCVHITVIDQTSSPWTVTFSWQHSCITYTYIL